MGQLVVLSGPSGVGKGTLVRALRDRHPELHLSISATTRSPRPGEVDGQDYYFLTRDRFEAMVAAGDFLEWAEFAGNCYGTPRDPLETKVAAGDRALLEIELEGARQVRQTCPSALQIFVLPPSESELERRLRGRGQDSDAAIAKRLNRARIELAAADEFDHQIINDDLDRALEALEALIFSRNG